MRSQQQLAAERTIHRPRSAVRAALSIFALVGVAACTDSPTAVPADVTSAALNRSGGRGIFQHYVALGSGMSMGWQSDGVTAESQYDSWPAQLARIANRELEQPYIASPSCFPPYELPFESLIRAASGPCANAPRVRLPAENLAIRGATVSSALMAMVGDAAMLDSNFGFTAVMPLVLPAGVTQVGAVAGLKPKIVSVEYGTSEILRGMLTSGMFTGSWIPDAVAWSALYDQILDEVSKSADMVVLAVPPSTFGPSGFVARTTLMSALLSPQVQTELNIAPPPEPCDLQVQRWIYVPRYLRLIISQAKNAQAPVPINCNQLARTDLSFSEDADALFGNVEQMRKHVIDEAKKRGFAYFDLETLYTSSPPFDIWKFLTTNEPFGPYVSLDGIYPTAAGNALLAEAAAGALNKQYNLGLPVSASTTWLAR